jgi:putative transposase
MQIDGNQQEGDGITGEHRADVPLFRGRQPIVRDDFDRQRRPDWLRRTVETYGWRLHAFVLMANHDHFFVESPEANLGAGMSFVNRSYTSYFNRRHRRVGHLFHGRFRSRLIEEEGCFLEVSRYIHLNPVRAGMVERPDNQSTLAQLETRFR